MVYTAKEIKQYVESNFTNKFKIKAKNKLKRKPQIKTAQRALATQFIEYTNGFSDKELFFVAKSLSFDDIQYMPKSCNFIFTKTLENIELFDDWNKEYNQSNYTSKELYDDVMSGKYLNCVDYSCNMLNALLRISDEQLKYFADQWSEEEITTYLNYHDAGKFLEGLPEKEKEKQIDYMVNAYKDMINKLIGLKNK